MATTSSERGLNLRARDGFWLPPTGWPTFTEISLRRNR
ncbi:MAG: hypothetical protein Ct9H300mP12_06370 [Acidimicrobiales bacterium]|nr:MAG: hypothetical protein Ct9H300mP12_06370 [Acidimicrobiales bacterium]